jgi:MarR family transcriptional regulator, 2-MHQ and catechol-resistance regulon repressor
MGTRYIGTKEEKLALNAYIKLMRAGQSLSGRVEAHFRELGLTASQFGVLEALLHVGPLNQKSLAAKILKSTGNITMVIDNLEKRGLVKRTRDEQDRRHFSIGITRKGASLITAFFPKHVERIVEEMSVLSGAEQDTLGRLCKKVGLQGVHLQGKNGKRTVS